MNIQYEQKCTECNSQNKFNLGNPDDLTLPDYTHGECGFCSALFKFDGIEEDDINDDEYDVIRGVIDRV